MSDESQREISKLQEEYMTLQNIIDSFDTKSLTIKAWSVTVSMSGIGAAFISHSSVLLLLSSFSAVVFRVLEYYWKSFQYAHFGRIKEIEAYIRGEIDSITPFQMSTSWEKNYKSGDIKRALMIMRWSNVAMPHMLIFLSGILLYGAERSCLIVV